MSPREKEVVDLVLKGFSNRKIAAELFVTDKTVKFHLTNIFRELNVGTRAELMAKHYRDRITKEDVDAFKQFIHQKS